MNLEEWTINYVKHKSMLTKKLLDHKAEGDKITFEFKGETQHYYIKENLDDNVLDLEGEVRTTIACNNTHDNFEFLLANWKVLRDKKNLVFLFVNVDKNTKWSIRPHLHDRIADPETLEEGLKTIFAEGS